MVDAIRDYGQDQELAKQFLKDFTFVNDQGQVQPKYVDQLTKLANRENIQMFVELADLEQYNQDLARQVLTNTVRYNDIFYGALDEILPTYKTRDPDIKDIMDVFIEQRLMISERNQRVQQPTNAPGAGSQPSNANNRPNDVEGRYPPDLIRRAEIFFKPSTFEAQPIREVKAQYIGHLVTVRGIVTRTTDVKPKITVVTYTCDQCGCETFQPVKGTEFTPLIECSSVSCKANKALGRLTMQTRGSKFIKFQEIRLQEHSDQVPTGHIPRSIRIFAFGEQTRQCVPGDHVSVTGVYLPIEKSGYRMRTGGLTADTYLEAHYITQMSKTTQNEEQLSTEPMPQEEAEELMLGHNNFLKKLSSSIAPEIYGHDKLKQALLLLLVGGVDKNTNGMKIRGNINICLMGDPGVAKSQLLNFIDRLAPRSQLTSGRGSSGVGLTAAVLRDPVTNEFVLEGGAMVLADRGICCIDEFDKMVEADRTAIHEVMEQQTVSIAKAGIMTVLNARVSILAAANPAYGRYNQHRSITDNLQLPPALLSRFDLLWLIRDQPDEERDLNLAEHITSIHKNPDQDIAGNQDTLDMKIMRRYINLCKTKNPIVPENLAEKLVDIYHDIRSRKRSGGDNALFTSPRSLLAIIRLSTAFARLRLGDAVVEEDIEAALSLYNSSRESIEDRYDGRAPLSLQILKIIREISESTNSRTIRLNDLLENDAAKTFTSDQVDEALEQLIAQESINFEGDEIDLLS